jgi:CubicO group peptidase (beta-lactamase class C family)
MFKSSAIRNSLSFLALGLAIPLSARSSARIVGDVVPGAEWQQTSPESVSYSSPKLEAMRAWVKTQATSSMMVIVQGRVIFSYGDVSHTSKIASVRKSVLGLLYGNYAAGGKIDLSKTVKQLGLDDKTPFLPIEEHATLEQLLAARSGIYIPTDNRDQQKTMPPRGSEVPGLHYLYNNWDFNAAGTAFERATGKDIYQALQTDLATPLGLRDYLISKQKKKYFPESVHPEYAMYLSARDMARLGLLMLDYGAWNGKQVIPADMVRFMTTLVTPFRDINPTAFRNYGEPERWGYGYLWWVWDGPAFPSGFYSGFLQGAYSAMGTGGTVITILPAKDMVVVHQVDIDRDAHASVSPSSYIAMLTMIANASCGDDCNELAQSGSVSRPAGK